jgi:hypothetical protein
MITMDARACRPSSSIPSALTQLAPADPLRPTERPHLLGYLAAVADPRARGGRRHPLVAILAIAAAAVLAGARSIAAWAADTPQPVRAALGTRFDPLTGRWSVPEESTLRRTLARLDPDPLARALGAWLADRDHPDQRRRAVAVDGKTIRGAGRSGDRVHLLACMDHAIRAVLAQRDVDAKTNEIPGVPTPARPLGPCRGRGHRRRAAHQPRRCRVPGDRHARPLSVHRQGQPAHAARPLHPPALAPGPRLDRTRDRGHGRIETRALKAVTVGGFGFPHVAQVIRSPVRPAILAPVGGGPRSSTPSPAWPTTRPPRLADLIRGHWSIENGLDYVRDVTFAEDASQVRTGTAPQVMACLRNLVIGALSRAGPVNLAAGLRHHSRDPRRPLVTIGIVLR